MIVQSLVCTYNADMPDNEDNGLERSVVAAEVGQVQSSASQEHSHLLGVVVDHRHVTLEHLGREDPATGRPFAVLVLGFGLLMAATTRMVASLTDSFVLHLGIAACFWLLGVFAWLLFVGRELLVAARAERPG